MGPLSVNLPPTVEPVRGAEIHVVPPWRALGSLQTIASAPSSGGYSRVTTVAFPRRLRTPGARHAGCDLCRVPRREETRLWPALPRRRRRLDPTTSPRLN